LHVGARGGVAAVPLSNKIGGRGATHTRSVPAPRRPMPSKLRRAIREEETRRRLSMGARGGVTHAFPSNNKIGGRGATHGRSGPVIPVHVHVMVVEGLEDCEIGRGVGDYFLIGWANSTGGRHARPTIQSSSAGGSSVGGKKWAKQQRRGQQSPSRGGELDTKLEMGWGRPLKCFKL
jgi:hypothetical protein